MISVYLGPTIGTRLVKTMEELNDEFDREYGHLMEPIYDGKGNTFHPNGNQAKLHSAGWRVYERKRSGCFWSIKWIDPVTREIWAQGTALEILKERNRLLRGTK